ncbi:MAG: sigma-54-dependent Fis family transcriptional regulator [bacterium]|nr:sigma-54-dependent Fis family transcriptional regulator [bacterium]
MKRNNEINAMHSILLVEDQSYMRNVVKSFLEPHGFRIDEAVDLKNGKIKLSQNPYGVIILDLKLPDGSGLELFDDYSQWLADKTIIMTANPSIPSVVEAIKKGAYNYLEKPVDAELLLTQVNKILRMNRLNQRQRSVIDDAASHFTFDSIIHHSKEMEDLIAKAKILAKTENTILIQGETGCGKEVLSHAIHQSSQREKQIFLPVNCASIPADLFESELFGFEKGAFTGAVDSYCGRFFQADKGTLFLDEIGELPLHIQAKLLRILDERVIYRLKSQKALPLDVRLITATNRDLQKEIQLEQFRSDLYYRLQESALRIPPLRERTEDILPLCRHFIEVNNLVFDKDVSRLSAEVETFFMNYPWPGNVRELKNTIKSIIPFKTHAVIAMDDLSYSAIQGSKQKTHKHLTLVESEKKHIYKILQATGYNILRSAELLGISRTRLYRKIKGYGLKIDAENAVESSNVL